MGGGLMQLVAYGAQDIYLTGNPQITFFKVVYRRHTNFSMETIQQTINGTPAASGSSTVTISRNGDLVFKVYVTNDSTSLTNGTELVNEVELEIGGQRIDRQYAEWNDIWNELTIPHSKANAFRTMAHVGHGVESTAGSRITSEHGQLTQIPLNFWFCRNPGLALPLIALQYHEVKLKFTWGTDVNCGGGQASAQVWADYIYLDTDERRRFAQVSHEYLIEQLQKQSADASGSFKLNFNHPVKELIWTSNNLNTYATAQLKLNGHDRFAAQQEEYFQLRQPFDYHTSVPGQNCKERSHTADNNIIRSALVSEAFHATTTTLGGKVRVEEDDANSMYEFGDNEVTTAKTVKPAIISYHFNTSDFAGHMPEVGELFEFIVTGTGSKANHATTTSTIIARVTAAKHGGSVGSTKVGGTATGTNYSIKLDRLLTEDTLGAAVVVNFTMNSAKRLEHAAMSNMTSKVNVYSFALKPEEHQPSGTCNFSRIDSAKLDIGTSTGMTSSHNIYAVNYNVLRIMSGMGGLAYSN
jgi:hypothetical protein